MKNHTSLVSCEAYLARSSRRNTDVKRSGWRLSVQSFALPTLHASRFTVFLLATALSLSLNLNLLHAASFGLAERVVEQKLANGLTVLMVERHQTPVVSLNMTFGVGGVNEQVGRTGLAHLYEHMAFKGTRTVGTKDYQKERPILEEWFRVGTELEQRQRELARKSQEKPASSEDQASRGCRNDLPNCKIKQDSSLRAMRWPCSTNATGESGSMRQPART
jgi:hypothetical protein